MFEGLFIKILSSLLIELTKTGFKKLLSGTPTSKAIQLTAKDFTSLENLKPALIDWCKSDDFIEELEKLSGTFNDVEIDLLTDSFIVTGNFYDNITIQNTQRTASEVLAVFFKHLEVELYKTEHAAYIETTKAKLRMQAVRADIQKLGQQNRVHTDEIKTHIDESLKQHFKPMEIESSPEFQEKLHLAAIDFAVRLLREGKMETARARLEELRNNIGDENDSLNLRFRLTANIGICAFLLEDMNRARTEFERALALKPDHKLILSDLALILSLQGNTEEAVECALRLHPIDGEHKSVAAANYIRVMHRANRTNEIKTLLETENWIERDPNCALSLGLIKFDEKEYEQSEIYFRTAHEGDPQNAHTLRLLAQTILFPINQIILNNPPLFLSEEVQRRIVEAESYLTEAVTIFDKYENKTPLSEALLQRAYVRGLLGNDPESLADCEWLLRISPGNDEALRQKGHTLLSSGKINEAIISFNLIKEEKSKNESILATALAYSRVQDYAQVINLLADKLDSSVHSRQQAILADLLLLAYHFTGDQKQASELVARLDAEQPDDPEMLVVTARQQFRIGQHDEAIERYRKAILQVEPGNQAVRIRHDLANAFYESGKWAEAAELYSEAVDQNVDDYLTRRYLTCLYNSGARDKVFELARKLRNDGVAIPFVSELEANILNVLGDYENALHLFEQLARLEPKKVTHRFSIAEMQQKLENFVAARATVETIDFEDIKDDVDALIHTAYLRQELNIGGELPFAHRARQVGISQGEIHRAYIQLFLRRTGKDEEDLTAIEVEADHFVKLKNKRDEITTYHIINGGEYDLTKGEIPVTDARAKKLLGRKPGDVVVFNEGTPTEARYEVSEVKTKYVYAFQESIKKHNEWFGGDKFVGLMVMNVAEGDFSSLFKFADLQKEHHQFIADKFREGNFPLATLARLSGKNLFEIWFSVTESSGLKIVASSGQIEQFEKETDTIKKNPALVIDLSGFLTLRFLGLLDKLPVAFTRLIITQSVNENLKEWQAGFDETAPFSTVWEDTGKSVHRQLTAEEVAYRREFINEIVSFVEQHVEILPAAKVLTLSSEKFDEYYKAFGASFTSVLLANEYNLPLYLDDFQLGLIRKSLGWELDEVSVQAILLKFKNMGLINQVEYWRALKKLIVANYAYISVNANALWWMCKDEEKRATSTIQKILTTILGPWCSEDSAVMVGAEFIRRVCLEVSDANEKVKLIDLTLHAVLHIRDGDQTILKLKNVLAIVLRYSQEMRKLVSERIESRHNRETEN